jgi:hypothetical protein
MKHLVPIAYQVLIFSLLCSSQVSSQEFQQSISYTPPIPIQPLSEKGKIFFEQQKNKGSQEPSTKK